jgi:hypothetical protein
MIIAIKAACNCGYYTGFYCGERATDQSSALKGVCNKNLIYRCIAANEPAQIIDYCSYCAKGEIMGTDYCAIAREGIYKFSIIFRNLFLSFNLNFLLLVMACTCMSVQGQLCGSRRKEDLLRGNCDDGLLYYCPGINQPAQVRGSCSQGKCMLGSTAGQDYCYGGSLSCTCLNEKGPVTICGVRRVQNLLTGDCNDNSLYICQAKYFPAVRKMECGSICLIGDNFVDSCLIKEKN